MNTIKIKAKLLKLDAPLSNGYILPKDVAQKMVDDWNNSTWEHYGELTHPYKTLDYFPIISLSDITHKVGNLDIEDGFITCELDLLNTEERKHIIELAKDNKLYASCVVDTTNGIPTNIWGVNITDCPNDNIKPYPLQIVENEKKDNAE